MTHIDGKTQLLGLLGWPVSHSLSPAMHNAAARALGLNLCYLPLAVPPDRIEAALAGLAALSFRGVNVTIPHKQAVMPHLDEIDPAAVAIGAVNTIVIGDKLVGYNTDHAGFMADLEQYALQLEGQVCWLWGAGGSARAVAYALHKAGAKLLFFSRRISQAHSLVAEMDLVGTVCLPWEQRTDPDIQKAYPPYLILNTTPLGMTPHEETSPLPEGTPFPAARFVYDLVYNPAETLLLRQARAAGIAAANGLGMLLHQGAQAFALWTGHMPDLSVMAAALEAAKESD
jgi:shikimate dehydrogenase